MPIANTKKPALSITTGGGKWIGLSIQADPINQTVLIAAEKGFWRAVRSPTPALVRLRATEAVDWFA